MGGRAAHAHRSARGPRGVPACLSGDGRGPDPGALPLPGPDRTHRPDKRVRDRGGAAALITPLITSCLNTVTPSRVCTDVRTFGSGGRTPNAILPAPLPRG